MNRMICYLAVIPRSSDLEVRPLLDLPVSMHILFFQVLICLCEAAMNIAKDTENRSILVDYDLIPVILKLCESV